MYALRNSNIDCFTLCDLSTIADYAAIASFAAAIGIEQAAAGHLLDPAHPIGADL
jgi:hypothetical protein